jgi:hypothetical protein
MVYRYIAASVIAAGLTVPTVSWAGSLGVHFSWAETTACSSTPPAFTVTNIPTGTKYLVFKLVDHDAPNFVHGGGQISYSGSGRIPAGAFASVSQVAHERIFSCWVMGRGLLRQAQKAVSRFALPTAGGPSIA